MAYRNALTRAVSGNFATDNTYIVYWIEIIQNSQNIANNTTNVTVKVWCKRTNTGYTTTGNGTCYCTINGTQYSASITSSQSITSTPRELFTKTMDISHNPDGTKTLSTSARITHSRFNSTGTGSYNQVLTSIPRVSTFSLNTSTVTLGSTALTVTINKSSSSFTHKVYYKFGNINVLKYDGSGTSTSFTPSISDCSQIPNAVSGTGQIVVETYNGSTKLGQNSANITLKVPDSVKPSFNSLVAELVANGINTSYGYVQNKSQCKLSISGSVGSYGSSITNYYISGGGFTGNSATATTGVLTQSGSITFSAYVTDSRGRRSDTKTVTINVKEYANPKILEFTAQRCLANGQLDEDGTYAKVYTNYSYSNLSGSNSLTASMMYRKTGDSTFVKCAEKPVQDGTIVIGSGKLNTTFAYEVRFELKDNFTTIGQSVTVATSFVTLDFRKGGKGIAIGKASEADNLLEVAMPLKVSSSSNCVTGDNNTATTAVSDLNKLWKSGFYDCDGGSNIPFSGWNWVIHSGHRSNNSGGSYNYGMQIAGQNGTNNFAMRTVNASGAGTWNTLYHTGNKPTWNDIGGKPTIISDGASLGRLTFSNWIYSTGNTGWYNSTYGGGWYMSDSTWLRVYNDKAIYSDGTIRVTSAEHRYLKGNSNGSNQNLDITVFDGKSIYLNPSATSGCAVYLNRNWSGSSGSEPSFYNTKGKGWGYIGNSENTWYRVYGAGGSVSDRTGKYEILKADIETQYDNVKTLNIYNYRTISSRDMSIEEIAETFFNTNFIDSDNSYITKSVEIDGKKYQEIDDTLPKEKIKEIRTKEIIDNNPHFEGCMREDLSLGCMVDEMPLETTFYDNEGGDGKAVDMYSYTTMILGATKHLITKVETLERENEELKNRLDKMEELLNGIINKE
ncbi:MAG: shufflon system plasmid conjugative transfer pilus tip adhesin PilV [Peptostreptococcaceae bacterium]|nr:shufflon system plasmid conjugative transfer pilus tip adhesin PilV [Peptostreptococcaceae bacterium]